MKLLSKFRGLRKSVFLFLASVLVLSTIAPLTKVFADAADPIPAATTGSFVVNHNGTITATVQGGWQWTTHHTDCNTNRYAVGYAVDWHDTTQPGNLVQNGSITAHVGTPTDNHVHYIHLLTDANPTGDPTGPTRCGTYAQHGVDSHGHPIFYNTGNWGPISHTYPADTKTILACVVTYDMHLVNNNNPNSGLKAGDKIAGGDFHNEDNSIEKNGNTPQGNGCFSANVQNLIVVKHVINDNGGTKTASDFAMHVNAVAPSQTDFPGSETGTTVQVGVGSYSVNEGSHTGYTETLSSGCAGSITAGQTKICTITNNDNAPSLTLNKIVSNTHGGTAHESAWTISATGPTSISGPGAAGSNDVVSGSDFKAGTYTLSESAGPSGYSASAWSCTNNVAVNGQRQITLANGQSTVCTITNSDVASTLTLVKTVINNNGGTKIASDFQGKIDGNNVAWSTAVPLSAGAHTASELGLPTYAASSWGGDCATNGSITLANGQNATCTITNDDIAPSLTLDKIVSNTHGGNAPESAWTLHADGASQQNPTHLFGPGAAGNTDVVSDSHFKADTYTLSETGGPSGYSASAWSCTNNVAVNGQRQITLANGQSTVCTITNSDIAPSLTVTKLVINPYGTPAPVSSFPLFVTGNSGITQVTSGQSNQFSAGNYTVSETQQNGYQLTSGVCDGQNSLSLTLNVGDNKSCTLTNTAIQPKLIVIKHVINDNSGGKSASDFIMTVTGNSQTVTPFSGSESPGTTIGLNEGNYTVDEQSHVGYTETKSADCSGTISIGETKTCTITNNDIPNPGIHIVKSGPAVAHEGDLVTYTYAVTNTGDTDLSNVTVDDNIAGQAVYQSGDTNNDHILPKTKTETWIFTKTYTVPTPQVPDVVNIGTACGDYSDGTTSGNICSHDTHTLDVIHPAIQVKKFGPSTAFAGDTVTYEFDVTNAGDTPLSGLTVNDNVAGIGNFQSGDANSNGRLDLSETWVYTKQFTIPSNQTSDITNTVTACGSDSLQLQVCNTDDHTTTVLNPGIHVVKSGPATAEPGQTVTYTFTVTNTGNTPLSITKVNDNVAGDGVYVSGDTHDLGFLDTDETWIYTASYTIPANQNVSVTNTVTACGLSGNPLNGNIALVITGHQVCDQDSHTTNIPQVLGTSTSTPQLVNTGQDALLGIFAGLAIIGLVTTVYRLPIKKR